MKKEIEISKKQLSELAKSKDAGKALREMGFNPGGKGFGFGFPPEAENKLVNAIYTACDTEDLQSINSMREYLYVIAKAMGKAVNLMKQNMRDITETEDFGDGPEEYGVDEAVDGGVIEQAFEEGLNESL